MNTITFNFQKQTQKGFVLAVSMIFLVVMTLLAIAAIKKSTLDEKIAFNLRAQNRSFQAAEKALRYCERGLYLAAGKPELCDPRGGIPTYENTGTPDANDASANFPSLWRETNNWKSGGTQPATQIPATGPDAVSGLDAANQPRCMIEKWPINTNTGGGSGSTKKFPAWVITARAGPPIDAADSQKGENAVVWLQEIIRCGNI